VATRKGSRLTIIGSSSWTFEPFEQHWHLRAPGIRTTLAPARTCRAPGIRTTLAPARTCRTCAAPNNTGTCAAAPERHWHLRSRTTLAAAQQHLNNTGTCAAAAQQQQQQQQQHLAPAQR